MTAVASDPSAWLLTFTSNDPRASDGDGRPWGDGTAMAARAYQTKDPWDDGCKVTPMIGGFAALNAIREAFEEAILQAESMGTATPPGERGHVYIADWLFNGLRDLSVDYPWKGSPWNPRTIVPRDQTAIGLVVRMMSAGIKVRILLWMPTTIQRANMTDLADEHWSVAAAVQDHNNSLERIWPNIKEPAGVVSLDLRTAAPVTASQHQKMIVIRVGAVNVAFCGGVDLAFTRRDFGRPDSSLIGDGDWQSGGSIPVPMSGWPKQNPAPTGGYPSFPYAGANRRFSEDLPENVYGRGYRHWHDQHLKLEGPIVGTLEQQFAEKWIISSRVFNFRRDAWNIGRDNQVQLTSPRAIKDDRVVPLPNPTPVPRTGEATVQMWRTIPLRPAVTTGPFVRGEFTVMAGVVKAVKAARELITIWDQYFWSVPLARLLAFQLNTHPTLCLMLVLPPFGTTDPSNELRLRKEAMQVLWRELRPEARDRVKAFNTWAFVTPTGDPLNVGVYVHAKVQTYDDVLMACGSANMNRRSLECDTELDCAVLHATTVREHIGALMTMLTGRGWDNFSPGWGKQLITHLYNMVSGADAIDLIFDPFFREVIGNPKTPNGVPIPYDGRKPDFLFEPTSIGSNVDQGSGCQFTIPDDPRAKGRLDQVTFLLERCHNGNTWPWRIAANSVAGVNEGDDDPSVAGQEIPRLTL